MIIFSCFSFFLSFFASFVILVFFFLFFCNSCFLLSLFIFFFLTFSSLFLKNSSCFTHYSLISSCFSDFLRAHPFFTFLFFLSSFSEHPLICYAFCLSLCFFLLFLKLLSLFLLFFHSRLLSIWLFTIFLVHWSLFGLYWEKYVPLLLPRWMEWPRRRWVEARFWRWLTASGRPDQSHRLAPMLWSGPTAETKPLYPMLAGGLWSWHNPNGCIWSEEMRCVMAESSRLLFFFSPVLEQHCVNDTSFGLFWSRQCEQQ